MLRSVAAGALHHLVRLGQCHPSEIIMESNTPLASKSVLVVLCGLAFNEQAVELHRMARRGQCRNWL